MAAAPVSLLPTLRPWQRAGVEFLLTEQNLPAPWSLCVAAPARSVPAKSAPPPHSANRAGRAYSETEVPSSPTGGDRSVPGGASRPPHRPAPSVSSGPAPSGPSAPSGSSVSPAAAPTTFTGPPPEQWPPIWQERLSKTAPAVVLWTYWALGEDLCLRPDPERRALLKKLLGDLGHPAGTHSFWPAALPVVLSESGAPQGADAEESGLHANPEIFWAGVQTLKARALVVMGSAALKALNLPPRLRPFQQTRHQGRLIVVLRDVDFLAKEEHRYDAVREFLKQALAPFGRV